MRSFFTALRFALALLMVGPSGAYAANRFWNPYIVTGAVSGTGGVCRLTISPAIVGGGLTTASTVNVTGITGATGCNVTAAISTVVDTTHIEITGTIFGGVYATGGCVAGGFWSSTNTANWAASSTATCGSGGSSVPVAADNVTFDANSLASTVITTYDPSFTLLTSGAFPGTLDFSVNNNNPTGTVSITGTATRTVNCGTGTFTLNGGAGATDWNAQVTTGLTLNCGSATLAVTGSSAGNRNIYLGGLTYGTVNIATNAAGTYPISFQTAGTIGTLTVAAGTTIGIAQGNTLTVNNAFTFTGTSGSPISIVGLNTASVSTISVGANSTMTWGSLIAITRTGAGTLVASNCLNLGQVTSITCNVPSAGGAGMVGIIGSSP